MEPSSIGKFKIQGVLGEGGMGVVYHGFDTELRRDVAVKMIKLNAVAGSHPKAREQYLARFLREARMCAKLHHQNIATIFEFGKEGENPFMVFEFIDGMPLNRYFARGLNFKLPRILDILDQVAAGLYHAHKLKIVHRDIKPQNMLITTQGTAKILDFGIAKENRESNLTKTGQFLGTPVYASPEQVRGEDIDYRSDIFSFGILCHELLTGRRPFQGETDINTLHRIAYMPPELHSLRPELGNDSSELKRLFTRVFQQDRELRPTGTEAFVQALREVLEEHSSSPAGASFDVATVAEILDLTMVDDPPSTPALQARPEAAAGRVTEMEDGFRPLQSSPEEGIAPTRRMEEHELQERFETDSSVSSRPVTMVEPPPPPSTNEVPPLNPEPRATRYKVPRRKATVTSSRVRTGLTLIIVLLLVAGLTWYVLDKAVPDSNDEVNEQAALPTPAQDTIPDSSAAQSGDRQADAEMENSDNRPTVGAQAPPSAGPESEALKTLRFKHKMLKQDVRRFKGQENVRLLRAVVKDCEKLLNELAALEKEWTGQRVDNVTLLQERLETLTNKFIEIESEYKKRKMRIRNRLEKQN